MKNGYYLSPAIHKDRIVFVSDNDLWEVDATGGVARRLTSLKAPPVHPYFSPDGEWLAFTGYEEGYPEVYLLPSKGGEIQRITYIGSAMTRVAGWTPDGNHITYISTAGSAFRSHSFVYKIKKEGGIAEKLPAGIASSISFGPGGGMVIGRFGRDPAQWKRYRGGRMGTIWIDRNNTGRFDKLVDLESNMTYPAWIGNRIYFMGDHEGWGNIYSVDLEGQDMIRHTHHDGIYVRNPRTDGASIVYHAGGDIYRLDLSQNTSTPIPIEFPSTRCHKSRHFVECGNSLENYQLHPKGQMLSLVGRGKFFTMAHWEGAVSQYGIRNCSVRYRLATWMTDGERLAVISDESGEERLELYSTKTNERLERFDRWEFGRPIEMKANPVKNQLALYNQRNELLWIDLDNTTMKTVDTSDWNRIQGIAWSPDGRWLAYGIFNTRKTCLIKIWNPETGVSTEITRPVLRDYQPAFDPDGKYLYFLSARVFDPVSDSISFDYNFPKGIQPMLITLRNDLPSPFLPQPAAPGEDDKDDSVSNQPKQAAEKHVVIDFDNILSRCIAFPVPEGRYSEIAGAFQKAFFINNPVEGTLSESWLESVPSAKGTLFYYDFEKKQVETFAEGVSTFSISSAGKTLAYQAGNKLRVLNATEKPDEKTSGTETSRKTGWIDLSRIKIEIDPANEWRQMFRETWRLLRDHFHHADMGGMDWNAVYTRYLPLMERISTRHELSDMLWELGGELGTSHCYEIGGDLPVSPIHPVGLLGADLSYDLETGHFTIEHIVSGDSWDETHESPLNTLGAGIHEGDLLEAVNGIKTSPQMQPGRLLLGLGGQPVTLTIRSPKGESRMVTVKTLRNDSGLRLRELIDRNTRYVHEKTNGRAGYIYMEDMGSAGYSQFFRSFLAEVQRDALIVDVRNNAGGHVSQLLLEKLARKRLGYDIPRYGKYSPLPSDSFLGPIVALTDEHSGSDGDIFSHTYKMMKLGLLIGTRTWGGIVGLNPTHPLVDGTVTTQPEFYNWMNDVKWDLENRGAEPDIIVEITPQDYASGKDPQFERAISEILAQLESSPPKPPEFGPHPSRKPPHLL